MKPSPPRAVVAFAALALIGCDRWALSVGGDGLLFIGISGDDRHLPGRFRVRTMEADGATRILDVPASGQLSLTGLSAGPVELTLLLPPDCRVAGPNPQTLTVAPDRATRTAFEVRCSS